MGSDKKNSLKGEVQKNINVNFLALQKIKNAKKGPRMPKIESVRINQIKINNSEGDVYLKPQDEKSALEKQTKTEISDNKNYLKFFKKNIEKCNRWENNLITNFRNKRSMPYGFRNNMDYSNRERNRMISKASDIEDKIKTLESNVSKKEPLKIITDLVLSLREDRKLLGKRINKLQGLLIKYTEFCQEYKKKNESMNLKKYSKEEINVIALNRKLDNSKFTKLFNYFK
jgi:hypothetical protein